MLSKIKFAVAGCGHIGKRHLAMISEDPDCELVAICDNREWSSSGTDAYVVPKFSSMDSLIESGLLFDVLSVATPNGLHEEHSLMALMTGHHVIIEKPMALTSEGCKRIISESEKYQRKIFCVMQNRFSPVASCLKGLVGENALGNIYMVQVNAYWNRDEQYYTGNGWHGTRELDGGVLFTQFSHFIDLLLWVFGDVENISSRFANFKHKGNTAFDDSGMVQFDFKAGGMGCLNFSTAVRNRNLESSITVIAENGTLKIGGQYMDELIYCELKDRPAPVLKETKKPGHYFIFRNVVEVLRGQARMAIYPEEGRRTVEAIERIYGSNSE